MNENTRKCIHAGSWYSNDQLKLQKQLDDFFDNVNQDDTVKIKSIIAPHAGF